MFYAIPGTSDVIHAFVDAVNKHVFTPSRKYGPTHVGVQRARVRLSDKTKANRKQTERLEKEGKGPVITRQQIRQGERRTAKRELANLKRRAAKDTKGGSVVVR